MNIAIIGSGIAGLTCAWRLAGHHQVTLFEAGATPGGHTATVDVATPQGTGPSIPDLSSTTIAPIRAFMGLLSELGIAGQKTQMSFSVHNPASGLEYNGHSLTSLFAQRRNLLKPAFWGLLSEIVRFNRLAKLALTEALDPARRWRASSPATVSAPSSPATIFCRWGRPSGRRRCRRCAASRCRCFCASLKTTVCWIFAIARNGTWYPAVPGNTFAPCSPGSAIAWIYASTRRCSRWTATRRGHPAAGVRGGAF